LSVFQSGFRQRIRVTPNPPPRNFGSRYEYFANGKWNLYQGSGSASSIDPCQKIEVTRDELHPGPPYVNGGPFHSVKANFGPFVMQAKGIYYSPSPVFLPGLGFNPFRLVGGFYNPDFSGFDDSSGLYGSAGNLIADPTVNPALGDYYTAASKIRPKISEADLGQAIAEAREIPKLLKDVSRSLRDSWLDLGGSKSSPSMTPKGVAEKFLGIEFGWMPLVKDVGDAIRVTKDFSRYVADRSDRNDQWDHVVRKIEETETILPQSSGTGWRVSPSGPLVDQLCVPSGGATGRWSFDTVITKRVWMTGDYKYYRPEFDRSLADYDSNMNRLQQAFTLYGARINPALLYKITPWTWLANYYTNLGNVIDQYQAAFSDGVVSKNLYLMLQRTKRLVFTQTMFLYSGTHAVSWQRYIVSKQRDRAGSPFGFGLNSNSLSAVQYSILAALGLSRLL